MNKKKVKKPNKWHEVNLRVQRDYRFRVSAPTEAAATKKGNARVMKAFKIKRSDFENECTNTFCIE